MFIIGVTIFIPGEKLKIKKSDLLRIFKNQIFYILLIIGVLILHLIEVNFIEPHLPLNDYTSIIRDFEGEIVFSFSQYWTAPLLYFFVIIYIGIYPFTLWFSPFYFLITGNKKAMKTFSYGLILIYIVTLPFYLFIPVTNVFTYYNIQSPLEIVILSVENFFYSTTTRNNCLPSLHTALTILIAYSTSLTGNKKISYFTYFIAITVIISVIYLSIHWITDVITGIVLSFGVIIILKKTIKEFKNE
ncbi:MAG: phosphatase PAP2 family protein [Thermoplasmatota archaeon]